MDYIERKIEDYDKTSGEPKRRGFRNSPINRWQASVTLAFSASENGMVGLSGFRMAHRCAELCTTAHRRIVVVVFASHLYRGLGTADCGNYARDRENIGDGDRHQAENSRCQCL